MRVPLQVPGRGVLQLHLRGLAGGLVRHQGGPQRHGGDQQLGRLRQHPDLRLPPRDHHPRHLYRHHRGSVRLPIQVNILVFQSYSLKHDSYKYKPKQKIKICE